MWRGFFGVSCQGMLNGKKGNVMELRISIPDEIAACLPTNGSDISRWLLEMAALEGYKSCRLTANQVQQMLGLQNQAEVERFLKSYEVHLELALEDLAEAQGEEQERAADQGVMAKLRGIKISAPPDFSTQVDLYELEGRNAE